MEIEVLCWNEAQTMLAIFGLADALPKLCDSIFKKLHPLMSTFTLCVLHCDKRNFHSTFPVRRIRRTKHLQGMHISATFRGDSLACSDFCKTEFTISKYIVAAAPARH